MTPQLKLSVIDIGWPGNMPAIVAELHELGYHRYWVTEHHGGGQSASPGILAALAAAVAEPTGLRIGIAGVLLNFHSPVAVASDFSLLELYFSGRLDFGVAGAGLRPDTSPLRPALLDGRPEPDRASYAEKVRELVRLMRRRPAARDALDAAEVGPAIATSPPIWLCGTSTETAELAGMLGLPYAFHHYLSHASADASYGLGVIQRYLDTFQPNDQLDAPEYNECREAARC